MDNGENGGKAREGLWNGCSVEIKNVYTELLPCSEKLKNIAKNKDIEALLSHIILLQKVDEAKEAKLTSHLMAIENKIREICKLKLDDQAPHKDFINKITARRNNDARVQLFTTNYDTLFEQAADKAGFVVIDGFSFNRPKRVFAGNWFDLDIVNREKTRLKQEENFVSKVFHLYKLHGSLDWTKDNNNKIIQKEDPDKPLIIYPASEKYESSYEQPYFEMMSRFQQALRKEETLLIVIGFGFQDKHIKNVIIEAVEQNPSFQLLIVNYKKDKNEIETGILPEGLEIFFDKGKMNVKRKVNIVFDTFKEFTRKYPENKTYPPKDTENATI
jgi:hypothetical protein